MLMTGVELGRRLVRGKHHLQKGRLNTGGPGHDGKINTDTFSLKMKEVLGRNGLSWEGDSKGTG